MNGETNLDRLKECFNESCLFSTQVSSNSDLLKEESRRNRDFHRISSKFTDQPKVHLKKVKEQSKKAKALHLEALKSNIKVKVGVSKTQRNSSLCRYEFIRMYHNKKFRLQEKSVMSEHKIQTQRYFRQSVEKFKNRRWLQEVSLNLRKQEKEQKLSEMRQTRRYDDKIFRETFRSNQQKLRKTIFNFHKSARQDRESFQEKKKNMYQFAITRAKFNYFSKVNQEMQRIKDYQDRLKDIADDNPESEGSSSRSSALPSVFGAPFYRVS